MLSWIRSHSGLKNVFVAIMVVGTAFLIAQSAYNWERSRGVKPFFYQSYYEPAVRMACGQPFGVDATCKFSLGSKCQISDEMKRFLRAEQQTLTCESVTPPKAVEDIPPARAWYHMFVMTAQIWKLTGISWHSVEMLPAVLLAISAGFVFLLFRLFMPLPVAAALAIVSILPALRFLPYMRDINKAPFILGALFVTVWLVFRTPTRLRLCIAMAATGIWLGIGYGFRPDVLIVLPLLILTILFFRPVSIKDGWFNGILALSVLIGSFILAASPILSAFNSNVGSCQWHFGLLGLSDIHTGILGLSPANYSWLNHYDDLAAWRAVESYGDRVLSIPSTGYCTPLYDQASRALYLEIFRTFPADFMTRGLAAARSVIGHDFWSIPWLEISPSWNAFFISHRTLFHGILLSGWVALGVIAMASSVRIGLFLILSLTYLSAYPAIQFDHRHFFHLLFLSWIPIGIILSWTYASILRSKEKNSVAQTTIIKSVSPAAWIRPLAILVGLIGILTFTYLLARNHQTTSVQRLFEQYLKASGDEVVVTSKQAQGKNMVLTINAPEYPVPKRIRGRMLRLDLGGKNCPVGTKKISVDLGGPHDPSYVFRKEMAFDFNPTRKQVTVFFPAYFETDVLSSVYLVIPQEDIGCVEHARWLRSEELPSLWIRATLYPDWRESKLYQWK